MKKILITLVLLLSFISYSQSKTIKYYNERGIEISKNVFKKSINYKLNLDAYYESKDTIHNILLSRSSVGKLNNKDFKKLKKHLNKISGFELDTTKHIIINYLSSEPKKSKNSKPKSTWNVLDTDYFKKINRNDKLQQYSVYNVRNDNLKYFHGNRIDWLADENDLIWNMFFPYEIMLGNFVIIRPNGVFYYYLGEHSKQYILEVVKKFTSKI